MLVTEQNVLEVPVYSSVVPADGKQRLYSVTLYWRFAPPMSRMVQERVCVGIPRPPRAAPPSSRGAACGYNLRRDVGHGPARRLRNDVSPRPAAGAQRTGTAWPGQVAEHRQKIPPKAFPTTKNFA